MGRDFVLSEWRGPENLCRRDQKGAMKRRPRHSSGDTTIIPHERLRQSAANGQRERSFGSSLVRTETRKTLLFLEKTRKAGMDR